MLLPVLRKVLWFTAIGWLTLLLIGPVLTVVGTVLPFALVGALVWLVWWVSTRAVQYFRQSAVRAKLVEDGMIPAIGRGARQMFARGMRRCNDLGPVVCEGARRMGGGAGKVFQAGVHRWREAAPAFREHARSVGCGAGRVARDSLHFCWEAAPALRANGRLFSEKMANFTRAATRIVVEMVCGAVVGGLVAWYTVGQTEQAVAVGALVGAALGFVVGGAKSGAERELVARE